MLPLRPVVLAAVLVSLAFAGCLKGGNEEPVTNTSVENETPVNETLPDGREFAAIEETTAVEEGVGGMEHKHDYWQGAEQIVIYDRDVVPTGSVFERGDNSKVFTYFINLENISETDNRSALIYEGTGKVIFEISGGAPTATEYQMSFRTAAKDWSPYAPIALATPFEYVPEKIETDMPHSFRSLWNWKLQVSGPVPAADPAGWVMGEDVTGGGAYPPFHVKITVVKARNVDDWPGHPAFYDGVDERIVVTNAPGKTSVQHAADVLVYGVEPDQVVPDKLISMGTRVLDVYVNITRLDLPPGVENAGFQLFWRSADTRPDDLGHSNHHNESDGATYAYWRLEVEEDMVDSPYQPTSRFSFKVLATPADDQAVYCYRCMPYELEYTITVIARPDPAAVPASLDE